MIVLRFIGFYNYTVILTYGSLLSAALGMGFCAEGRFTAAILCLLLCGICDAFDGMVARSKKDRTDDEKTFGIQIDSLCDAVSFGIFPAFFCHTMGADGVIGFLCCFGYSLCAVIRLAFFNVLEEKRQKTEGGANKFYRGLPVTSISMILPVVYLFRNVLGEGLFIGLLHAVLGLTAFLFILDFSVKKPDLSELFENLLPDSK